MHILLILAGVIVALVFIAVSAAMNVTFVASLGRTTFESQLFGAVSLACDAAKALLPIACAHALRSGQRLRATIGIVMFALFTVTSFLSAVGFTAVNRMTVAKSAEDRTAQRAAIMKEIAGIEARIANLPAHRPAAVIVEALAGAQLDRRWTLSKQCTDVTDARSRTHCEAYFALRAEHAAALEADKLDARRTTLATLFQASDPSPADVDAQAGVVATALALERGTIQRVLVLLVALIVEIGSGFGLYLAWVPAQLNKREKNIARNDPVLGREEPLSVSEQYSAPVPDPDVALVSPASARISQGKPVASQVSEASTIPLEALQVPTARLPEAASVRAIGATIDTHPHRDPEIMRAILRRPAG